MQKVFNMISVVLLCSDLLSRVHQFQVPEYDKLRPQLILDPPRATVAANTKPKPRVPKPRMAPTPRESLASGARASKRPSRRVTSADEKLDDADFFLNDYADLLKVVPVSFGLLEYILL